MHKQMLKKAKLCSVYAGDRWSRQSQCDVNRNECRILSAAIMMSSNLFLQLPSAIARRRLAAVLQLSSPRLYLKLSSKGIRHCYTQSVTYTKVKPRLNFMKSQSLLPSSQLVSSRPAAYSEFNGVCVDFIRQALALTECQSHNESLAMQLRIRKTIVFHQDLQKLKVFVLHIYSFLFVSKIFSVG